MPDWAIDSLARALLPAIQKYFESDDGKREFAGWKQSQLNKKLQLNTSVEAQRNVEVADNN